MGKGVHGQNGQTMPQHALVKKTTTNRPKAAESLWPTAPGRLAHLFPQSAILDKQYLRFHWFFKKWEQFELSSCNLQLLRSVTPPNQARDARAHMSRHASPYLGNPTQRSEDLLVCTGGYPPRRHEDFSPQSVSSSGSPEMSNCQCHHILWKLLSFKL